MKKIFILVVIVLLSGCDSYRTEKYLVSATIIEIQDAKYVSCGKSGGDPSKRTLVELEDGQRENLCGVYGKIGDTFKIEKIRVSAVSHNEWRSLEQTKFNRRMHKGMPMDYKKEIK